MQKLEKQEYQFALLVLLSPWKSWNFLVLLLTWPLFLLNHTMHEISAGIYNSVLDIEVRYQGKK